MSSPFRSLSCCYGGLIGPCVKCVFLAEEKDPLDLTEGKCVTGGMKIYTENAQYLHFVTKIISVQ